jgi:hypothetical protein
MTFLATYRTSARERFTGKDPATSFAVTNYLLPNPKQETSSIYTVKKTIYKLKLKVRGKGRGIADTRSKPRRLEGVKVSLEEKAKAGRNSGARGWGTVVDSLAVSKPQNVNCHRMTGLETVSILATEETGTTSWPREQGLRKSDRTTKTVVLGKI